MFNTIYLLSDNHECEVNRTEVVITGIANGVAEHILAKADGDNKVVIDDVKKSSKRDVTVKLKAIELNKEGFGVTSFEITSLSSTFAASGVDIVNTEGSNAQPGNIGIKLSSPGILPVKVGYRMRLSKNATADIELNGEMSFASLDEVKGFNVTGPDSEVKAWEVSIAEFTPQLLNGNLDGNWTKADWSNYYLYPNPVGREGWPYWSNANMNLVVKIEATQRTEKGNGYAARLQTVEVNAIIIKKIAAGSLFLGWFDADNATRYMNDPTRLTFRGIPFCASKKIAGLKVDFTYTSGGSPTTDSGSIGIQLVNHDQKEKPYVYHGLNKTGDGPHADNTAVQVAGG